MVMLLSLGGATYRQFPLAVLFHNLKALIIRKWWELDEKCLKNTYSNFASAYWLVMLLQLRGAAYCWFPLPVRFATSKALIHRERWKLDTMFLKNTNMKPRLTLSIGQVVSVTWRHLPPIHPNDLFSRLLKALITRKRWEPFIDFSSKTAKISENNLISF
jgi:hypothetical protein